MCTKEGNLLRHSDQFQLLCFITKVQVFLTQNGRPNSLLPTVEILVRIKILFSVHAKVVVGDPAKSLNMTLFTNGIYIPMHICLLTWLVGACYVSAGVNDKRS